MRAFDKKKGENPSANTFFSPKIQTKLQTGTPGDRYEVEADKVADKVVNKPKGGLLQSKSEEIQQKPLAENISMVQKQDMKEEETVQKKTEEKEETVQKKEEDKETVQAKCKDCEEDGKVQKKSNEEEKPVQTKLDASQTTNLSSSIETNLNRSKGSGQKMEKSTQHEMEAGFGSDFSSVTIHTDSNAVQMSEELGAHAFTHGNDVYFNNGKYNPNTKEGKHLLAHELTHTVQQKGATKNNIQKLSDSDCGSTVSLPIHDSCIDFVGECYSETFKPKTSGPLHIVVSVDYMEPQANWIKEDFSVQVIKCGILDDTNIGSKRISENMPATVKFDIASVTPEEKYFIRIKSRSDVALKSAFHITQ